MTEDEMVGWHHQRDGHEFEQALGVGDGQGSLACCSSWGHKESDTTEQLNLTELNSSSNCNFSPQLRTDDQMAVCLASFFDFAQSLLHELCFGLLSHIEGATGSISGDNLLSIPRGTIN